MDMQTLTTFFMWCTVLNVGLLTVSWLMLISMPDLIFRLHGGWFGLSRETFNAVIYGFLGFYKILILVFCVVPYFVLLIMG